MLALNGRWLGRIVIVTLLVLHVGLVVKHFPPSAASPANPICSGDLHWHFASSQEGREVLTLTNPFWGYSPNYMAGYPYGLWNSAGRKGYDLAPVLLPMLPVTVAFYLYALVTALLPPFLLAAAAWILGLKRRSVAYCFAMGVIVYQLDNLVSYFWTFGNVAFPSVNALAVLSTALLVAGFERKRWRLTLGGAVTLALVGYLHPLVFFPVAAAAAAACLLYRREMAGSWRGLLHPLLLFLMAGALLAPWAALLLRFSDARLVQESRALPSGLKYLVMDLLSDRAYRHPFDRRFLFHVQLVLLAVGACVLWRRRERALTVLVVAAMASFLFAYLFAYCPGLRRSEPYRYLISFSMFAVIPGARGLEVAVRLLRDANRPGRLAALCLALVLLPPLGGHCFDVLGREPVRGLGRPQRAVVEWINAQSNRAGRVACDDIQLGNMLRYHTGAAIIGGGISVTAPLRHSRASLGSSRIGTEPASTASKKYVEAFLERYNVRTVIAATPRLRGLLVDVAGFRQAFTSGPYAVFVATGGAGSWLFDGRAEADTVVTAAPNLIRIEAAPSGEFVLRYHYMQTLESGPDVTLFPVLRGGDPVPFIGVRNPKGLGTIEIRNRVAVCR